MSIWQDAKNNKNYVLAFSWQMSQVKCKCQMDEVVGEVKLLI